MLFRKRKPYLRTVGLNPVYREVIIIIFMIMQTKMWVMIFMFVLLFQFWFSKQVKYWIHIIVCKKQTTLIFIHNEFFSLFVCFVQLHAQQLNFLMISSSFSICSSNGWAATDHCTWEVFKDISVIQSNFSVWWSFLNTILHFTKEFVFWLVILFYLILSLWLWLTNHFVWSFDCVKIFHFWKSIDQW